MGAQSATTALIALAICASWRGKIVRKSNFSLPRAIYPTTGTACSLNLVARSCGLSVLLERSIVTEGITDCGSAPQPTSACTEPALAAKGTLAPEELLLPARARQASSGVFSLSSSGL